MGGKRRERQQETDKQTMRRRGRRVEGECVGKEKKETVRKDEIEN